jgi:hypothetical protein
MMPHRFRPPKNADHQKWEMIKFLVEYGFRFQHLYKDIKRNQDGTISYTGLVPYPENLREAQDFVERYKQQAIKE